MIDYWDYTGDATYNDLAVDGIAFQADVEDGRGPFMSANWTAWMENDSLGFWGLTAMLAAEMNFPNPPKGTPSWAQLAQGVFGTLEARYQKEEREDTCAGGLRWAVLPQSGGYGYKNTISNGVFLNLSARLARYTGNQTYGEWANKTWTWLTDVGFVDESYDVYDGAHVAMSCNDTNHAQFSANAGVLLQGAAYMYNQVCP